MSTQLKIKYKSTTFPFLLSIIYYLLMNYIINTYDTPKDGINNCFRKGYTALEKKVATKEVIIEGIFLA